MKEYANNFFILSDKTIEDVKRVLKEELKSLIDNLSEREEFWIYKYDKDGQISSVGWKIAFPNTNDDVVWEIAFPNTNDDKEA